MLVLCASFAATANAQEAKLVSGKVHLSNDTEITLPEGSQFLLNDFGTTKSLTPLKINKAEEDVELGVLKITASSKPYKAFLFNNDIKKEVKFKKKKVPLKFL